MISMGWEGNTRCGWLFVLERAAVQSALILRRKKIQPPQVEDRVRRRGGKTNQFHVCGEVEGQDKDVCGLGKEGVRYGWFFVLWKLELIWQFNWLNKIKMQQRPYIGGWDQTRNKHAYVDGGDNIHKKERTSRCREKRRRIRVRGRRIGGCPHTLTTPQTIFYHMSRDDKLAIALGYKLLHTKTGVFWAEHNK